MSSTNKLHSLLYSTVLLLQVSGSSLGWTFGVDLVVNSISDFLSAQINGVLNNILSNKLKIPGLYVNFSGSLYNPNPIGAQGSAR